MYRSYDITLYLRNLLKILNEVGWKAEGLWNDIRNRKEFLFNSLFSLVVTIEHYTG